MIMHHDQLHRPFLQRCAEHFHRLDHRAVHTAHGDQLDMQHLIGGIETDGPDMLAVAVRKGCVEQNGGWSSEKISAAERMYWSAASMVLMGSVMVMVRLF